MFWGKTILTFELILTVYLHGVEWEEWVHFDFMDEKRVTLHCITFWRITSHFFMVFLCVFCFKIFSFQNRSPTAAESKRSPLKSLLALTIASVLYLGRSVELNWKESWLHWKKKAWLFGDPEQNNSSASSWFVFVARFSQRKAKGNPKTVRADCSLPILS